MNKDRHYMRLYIAANWKFVYTQYIERWGSSYWHPKMLIDQRHRRISFVEWSKCLYGTPHFAIFKIQMAWILFIRGIGFKSYCK